MGCGVLTLWQQMKLPAACGSLGPVSELGLELGRRTENEVSRHPLTVQQLLVVDTTRSFSDRKALMKAVLHSI